MRDSGILFSHQVNLIRKYSESLTVMIKKLNSKSDSTDMDKLSPLPRGITKLMALSSIFLRFPNLYVDQHVELWFQDLKWLLEF